MIRYSLTCDKGHDFDSWFQSAAAFDALAAARHLSCAVCGSVAVTKALMAPAVQPRAVEPGAVQAGGVQAGANHPGAGQPNPGPTGKPAFADAPGSVAARRAAALAAMRREIEENADYVGLSFAAEARAIHDGDAPERAIYGEAAIEDARKLIEDGIPVAPLPFLPKARTH